MDYDDRFAASCDISCKEETANGHVTLQRDGICVDVHGESPWPGKRFWAP